MRSAPKSFRLHIGIFGRRNAGKSSLLNALARQMVSIVSDVAGTTTDPVEKPMEILPIGPCLFIDTAGVDDVGALGELRAEKTRQVFERTDIALVVAQADLWGEFEEDLVNEFTGRKIPVVAVFNKVDVARPNDGLLQSLTERKVSVVQTAAVQGEGILDLRDALIKNAPEDFINAPSILGDLVPAGEMAVLVVPIDMEAPKGRLIMPQV
ncbi:TPA: [FeFe] hydrogenase H-cluster maturation GTPase HydF, partial [Candidatus Sumerlaeota bacterium]|nr:[FeFe] hydrogenase H-cluster maturation GTPase HydF [Candidatus Sumerlaeota bacterium]